MGKTKLHLYLTLLLFCIINCSNFKDNKGQQTKTQISETDRYPIYTSSDLGQTWLPLKLGLPKNTQVSFLKNIDNEILIATDNEGLFLSEDNLSKSRFISSMLPGKKINAIHVYDDEIYTSVYKKGLFVSKDKGLSWHSLNKDLPDLRVQAILKIGEELIIGTDNGIFKSTRNGTWEAVYLGTQIVSLNESSGKIIAGASMGTLMSEDSGDNWKWIHQEGAAHNTEIINGSIFIMNVSGDVFKSKDWGEAWESLNYMPREASYVYDIIQIGNSTFLSNNYGIHRSNVEGVLWNLIYPREDAGFFDLHVKGNVIFGGTRTWNEWRNRKN